MNWEQFLAIVVGVVIGLFILVAIEVVFRLVRRRFGDSPQIRLLILSNQISPKPESRLSDSSYVAFVARNFDEADSAPREVRENSDKVHLIDGPFDGCVGLYPPGMVTWRAFIMPVHRSLKRFAVYRQSDSSVNWEGAGMTTDFKYRFERFLQVNGWQEATKEMERIDSQCQE